MSASRVRIEASASIAAVVLSLVAGTSSCGGEGEETGGEGEGGALCRGGVARLHECGVVTNGYFACVEPTTAEDDCMLSCVADADCDDLRMLTCAGLRRALDAPGLVLTHAIGLAESWSPALENCYLSCAPPARECTAGAATFELVEQFRCDGEPQCEDGSDEQDCSGSMSMSFTCPSIAGSSSPSRTLPKQRVCDGKVDCPDGADEDACRTHRCDDGGAILAVQRCDGMADCLDASDEAGCGQVFCD